MTVRLRLWIGVILFSFGVFSSGAQAAPFTFKRGVGLDIWVTWPSEEQMATSPALSRFPEWRQTVPMDRIALLAEAGFDFVRMPIEPAPFLLIDDQAVTDRLIRETVETAQDINALGLKVIVDLHPFPRENGRASVDQIVGDPEVFERYLKLVSRFALAMADVKPEEVAFELMNEPNHECAAIAKGKSQLWEKQLVALHRTAREAAPQLTLVLSGACWGSASGLAALDPRIIKDDNVIWSFHTYEPFLASHQYASWVGGPEQYFSNVPYPPGKVTNALARKLLDAAQMKAMENPVASARHLLRGSFEDVLSYYRKEGAKKLREPFAVISAWAKKHKIPSSRLLLGEFGTIKQDRGLVVTQPEWRAAMMRDIRQEAEKRGIGWAIWSHSGAFAITTDDQSRDLDPVMMEALGLSTR